MTNSWKKVLYENFNVPDNYVDSSFLKNMKKNLYVKEYNLYETVIEAGSIHHQFCWIQIFVLIYIFMRLDIISAPTMGCLLLGSVVLMYLTVFFIDRNFNNLRLEVRVTVTTVLLGVVLSPVLHSLTASISTDTIYALTLFLLLASWACHEYRCSATLQTGVGSLNALSVNAGLMASLCLASRLPSLWHTVVMVNAAMAVFGLQPHFTEKLKSVRYPWVQISMTVMLTVACVACFSVWVSTAAAVGIVLVSVAVNVVCPLVFLCMQRLKNNIHGPWDEAVPR